MRDQDAEDDEIEKLMNAWAEKYMWETEEESAEEKEKRRRRSSKNNNKNKDSENNNRNEGKHGGKRKQITREEGETDMQ